MNIKFEYNVHSKHLFGLSTKDTFSHAVIFFSLLTVIRGYDDRDKHL